MVVSLNMNCIHLTFIIDGLGCMFMVVSLNMRLGIYKMTFLSHKSFNEVYLVFPLGNLLDLVLFTFSALLAGLFSHY